MTANNRTATANTLREAAMRIRDTANAATPGPWRDSSTIDGARFQALVSDTMPAGRPERGGWDDTEGYGGFLVGESLLPPDRSHIALWNPTTALLIADWLEHVAHFEGVTPLRAIEPALAVARHILGEEA